MPKPNLRPARPLPAGLRRSPAPQTVQRAEVNPITSLSESTMSTIYGCSGLFDLCSDQDLMSLSFMGQEKFLDWIGWEATNICRIKKYFVTWIRPEYSNGSPTAGYLADPCADSNGVEWGKCDFTLEDFGRLRRHTPTRDITKVGVRLCEAQPRYRLDGTPINDDLEYDMRITTEGIVQDLKRYVITGAKTTSGLFDGLESLVTTDYHDSLGHRCKMMDSIVIDWNANGMAGGNGITWNGLAVGATYGFVDVLLAVFRAIMQRISWSQTLAKEALQEGDMVIAAPTKFCQCLLNAFTCWSVCPTSDSLTAYMNTFEGRKFRDDLNGGMFGGGTITLDGVRIPLIPYDWELQKGPTLNDVYLLTGHIGSTPLINGQYNDMRVPSGDDMPGWYDYTDGGRLLTWTDHDETCVRRQVEMQPRLLMWAPWAQVRFTDVKCTLPGPVILADPTETSFYPESSFLRLTQ